MSQGKGKISRQKLEFLQSYVLVRAKIETFLWICLLSFLAILAFQLSFNYWECNTINQSGEKK